jgi:hypothetical protein
MSQREAIHCPVRPIRPKPQIVTNHHYRSEGLAANLISQEAVLRVAECDIVFGCMDGVEGRHVLNRLATFYNLPYFDAGVRLDADGQAGIERIAGAVHYLQPGLSSLLSRGVYSMARVEAEEMQRSNPDMYRRQVKEGYLRGVEEDRPAVISVNMFFARAWEQHAMHPTRLVLHRPAEQRATDNTRRVRLPPPTEERHFLFWSPSIATMARWLSYSGFDAEKPLERVRC